VGKAAHAQISCSAGGLERGEAISRLTGRIGLLETVRKWDLKGKTQADLNKSKHNKVVA
jgi:hypothetical protein